MLDKYKTLKKVSEGYYKEKGSKFIGIAAPCYNEAEAKLLLEEWKKAHHQARHLCWAYRFEVDHSLYRANDDGEPSNSAGTPILGQIQAYDLTNVLIGVVRYYGGVKLGVGGLIHAYKTAAKEAIEQNNIVVRYLHQFYGLQFDYTDMPHIMNFVKEHDFEILNQVFEHDCFLKISVPLEHQSFVANKLEEFNSLKLEDLGVY